MTSAARPPGVGKDSVRSWTRLHGPPARSNGRLWKLELYGVDGPPRSDGESQNPGGHR